LAMARASGMTDDRALRRALQIERATRNLYEKRLRELMTPHEFAECRRICRGMALAGCDEPNPGKDDQRATEGTPS
jgi:hypothetical protein